MSSLLIKIGAVLDNSFSSTMTGSNTQLSRLGSTIEKLKQLMKPGSELKGFMDGIATARKSWKASKDEVKSLTAEMAKMEKPSKTLKARLDKASASVIKARTNYLKNKEALRSFSEKLRKSGGNVQSLINDHNRLGASLDKLRNQYTKLDSAIKKRDMFLGRKAYFKSQMLETVALALGLAAPLKAAIDYESVMSNIRAVMKFSDDKEENDKGFKELSQGIKELSREIPLSAAELAQITTSGARLRLREKKDLLEFTEIVSKMAVNFGMSAEEVGSDVSNLYSIYKMSLEDLRDLGDLVNHIASNTSVEPKDLMAAINIASGAAKQFGLKIEQTAGLISALIKLGKQPKKAAATVNDMLLKLQTAREQGDEFIETLEEIGIDIEELEENIKKDPHKALLDVLEILKKYGSSDILFKLFGSGAKDIALLLENSEAYGEVLDLLADKEKRKNSLQEEFSDRASTTANKLQLLKNSIAEVGMNLGSVMLPPLNWVSGILRKVTESIAWFAEECPVITTGIMSIITALISLKVLVVSGGYVWNLVRGGMLAFSVALHGFLPTLISLSTYAIPAVVTGLSFLKATALSLATSALPAVTAGVRFLTAAIVSNPIGAVITAIVAGAVLIISNWQKVKDFFSSIWEYIKSIIKPIGEMFSWMGNTIGSIFGKVSENSPLKEFEKRKSIVAEIKTVHTPLKFSNGNPLLNNNIIKEISEKNKSNVRIKSFIEEKKSIEDNQVNKVFEKNICEKKESKTYNQTFHQTFNINVKAEPHQDTRSIADAVMERFREQARSALFDIVEPVN